MRHSDEVKITMAKLVYFTDLGYAEIARQCSTAISTVALYALQVLSPVQLERRTLRVMANRTQKNLDKNPKAYILIVAPSWYTGFTNSGKALEHIINWCKSNGVTQLAKNYVVHHVDHDNRNNHVSNLQLMTRAEHAAHHHTGRRKLAC